MTVVPVVAGGITVVAGLAVTAGGCTNVKVSFVNDVNTLLFNVIVLPLTLFTVMFLTLTALIGLVTSTKMSFCCMPAPFATINVAEAAVPEPVVLVDVV